MNDDDMIEKIDTTRPINGLNDIIDAIKIIEYRLNEVIEKVNFMFMPDEDTYIEDEDDSTVVTSDIITESTE